MHFPMIGSSMRNTDRTDVDMQVLVLTDNFVPEQNASARRTYEHCRRWVRDGVSVTVITTVPNFPLGKPQAPYRNRLYMSERIDGIRVVRVWSFLAPNSGVVLRALDFASFAVSGFIAGLFQKADIIVATSPQLLTAVAGHLLGRFKRRPWVFEVRDLWPESITAVGAMKEGFAMRLLRWLERTLYGSAARIVTVTESIRNSLAARGIPSEKLGLVPNGADLERLTPRDRDTKLAHRMGVEGKFVVAYVGTLGLAQGLEVVVRAAQLVRDTNIHFLFVGEGARRKFLMDMTSELGLENVSFVGGVPSDAAVDYLALGDAIVIPLRNSELFEGALPTKIFEAAAMERPIVLSAQGISADLIRACDAGIVVEPENPAALAAAVESLAASNTLCRRYSTGCKSLARQHDRERLAALMLAEIRDAANPVAG